MHKKTQENTCVGLFFVMKLLSKKETLAQVFFLRILQSF